MKRTLGVCYYPEHWPEDQWASDAAQMVATGLTWVRTGEFGWSRKEPKPAALTGGWLDRAIEVLGDAGLKIILGTLTATRITKPSTTICTAPSARAVCG